VDRRDDRSRPLDVTNALPPPRVTQRLLEWESRWGAAPPEWREQFLAAMAKSPDADLALLHWERWLEESDQPWSRAAPGRACRYLTALFSQSRFLSGSVFADPTLGDAIRGEEFTHEAWPLSRLEREVRALLRESSPDGARACIARWRRWHLVRIGLRDILDRALMEHITRELADLAQVVTQAALDLVWERRASRWGEPRTAAGDPIALAVIGMGKLGGRELNFSSDIDLIFIYSAEGESGGREGTREGRVPAHQFMRRVCEDLAEFIADVGPEGRLYRVDLRLRPEGRDGPIARSLESFRNYFASQARLWERLAHTKARVIAQRGDERLAAEIATATHRFCYGSAPGPALPRALAGLKHRIDREVELGGDAASEVKRGSGGIREIEFVVGLFQLIHGHTREDLRAPGFFETLRGLERHQVLSASAAHRLRRAYETLRRVEHRLQMMSELQTHTLPSDPAALESLARRLGWSGADGASVRRQFLADLNQITSTVHQAFLQHIGAPEISGLVPDLDLEVAAVLDEETPVAQAAEILARFGFSDPGGAVAVVRGLGRGSAAAYVDRGAQAAFETLLPALLAWCPQIPSTDLALRQLARFVDAYKARGVLFRLMADQPQLVEVLMRLFGTSELLGKLLASRPEYFDSVVARGLGLALPQEALDEMWGILAPRDPDDPERLLETLRSLRHMFRLAIALRHLLGLDPWTRLGANLTMLAEFGLTRAWRALIDEGSETPEPITCIALGKFGGRELNIESDLDVVFVCSPPDDLDEPDVAEWISARSRRCERLLAAGKEVTRRGALFELDTRLRPEGRSAPLLCTQGRLARYFAEGAQLWEFQTFLRARPVAGDLALGERVVSDVHNAMRARLRATDLPEEILAMRRRLEENADHPGGRGSVDLKRDPGGIVDVEFLVQAHQLARLRDEGESPERNTGAALVGMGSQGAALGADETAVLRRHLLTLRAVECQLRLAQANSSSAIPADPERWQHLAVAHLGPRATADQMQAHVADVMGDIRRAFDKALRPSEPHASKAD
jgi:glutamate-ammonia-ligase adenylyltransferase